MDTGTELRIRNRKKVRETTPSVAKMPPIRFIPKFTARRKVVGVCDDDLYKDKGKELDARKQVLKNGLDDLSWQEESSGLINVVEVPHVQRRSGCAD